MSHYAKQIALYKAVLAAGFSLGPMKTFATDDGGAWSTSLLIGKKVIIEARNDGHGGPDDVRAPFGQTLEQTEAFRAQAKKAREKLIVIPEVQEFLHDFQVDVISYGNKPQAELDAEIAKIKAEPAKDTDDHMGNVIATLAETKKEIARIKRAASKKLMWAEKHHEFGTFTSVNCSDTPENRESAKKKWPESFEGFQGFLSDLVADL